MPDAPIGRPRRRKAWNAVNGGSSGRIFGDFGSAPILARCWRFRPRTAARGLSPQPCAGLAQAVPNWTGGDGPAAAKTRPPKGRPSMLCLEKGELADRRGPRARDRDRLAGLQDLRRLGGLGEIRIGARRDPERCNGDTGNQRHHHDLQVGRAIRRVN